MAARRRTKKPDGSGALIVQPHARTQSTWTPSLIRSAEISAQNGDLRLAAQLCEWLLGDERIAQALHTRAQALLGLTPTFEPSGDKRKTSRVVRALEGQEDWWDGWPEPVLTELVVWGILLGVGFGRHRWETLPGHGDRILPRPVVWEAQHVRYDFNGRTWIAKVVSGDRPGYAAGTDEPFEAGDGNWIVHAPYGAARPWMRGLWRGLGRFRLLRDYAINDLGRAGEGAARNVVEADKEAEQTEITRRELAEDLSNMGRDGTIVLPPGLTYKLVATSDGAASLYELQLDRAELAIDIAIRGGNLTTKVDGGSRAAAEVQERRGDLANLRFDAQALTTTVHDQSMVWWAEFNFGSGELAPWPVYPVEEEEDLKAKVEGEEKAFTVVKQAEELGFDVDRKAFLEEHKISWAKPGKPKPVPPPAPAPGTPPAPGQPGAPNAPPAPPSNGGAKPEAVDAEARAQTSKLQELLNDVERRLSDLWDASVRAEDKTQTGLDRLASDTSQKIDQLVAAVSQHEESLRKALERAQGPILDTAQLEEEVQALVEAHAKHEREFQKISTALAGQQQPPKVQGLVARLASGFLAAGARGFVDGQLAADAIVEGYTAAAVAELESTITAITEELDAATGYEDLRARLHARYPDLDPEGLSELVRKAMLLGELLGMAAVNEDA